MGLLCALLRAMYSDPRRAEKSQYEHQRAPEGRAVNAELLNAELQPAPFFLQPPYLFLLANDLERGGSCGAKPQLSGRRSHRWARLSQLNPQAAGSDDAQDASYQQDVP